MMERKSNLVVTRRAAIISCAVGAAQLAIPRIASADDGMGCGRDVGDIATVFEGSIRPIDDKTSETRASVTGPYGTARLDFLYSNLSFHWSISLKATAPAMSVDGDITLFELDDLGDENGVVDWTEISLDYGKRSKSGSFDPWGLVPSVNYDCVMTGIGYDFYGSPIAYVAPGLIEHIYFSSYPS